MIMSTFILEWKENEFLKNELFPNKSIFSLVKQVTGT